VTTVAYAGIRFRHRFDKNSLLLIGKFFPYLISPRPPVCPLNNYQYLTKTPVDKNQFNQRIDFNQSSKSQWFGRYSWNEI